jgi:hypothetical protein
VSALHNRLVAHRLTTLFRVFARAFALFIGFFLYTSVVDMQTV